MEDLEQTTSISEPVAPTEALPLSRAARREASTGSRVLTGLGFAGLLAVPIVGTLYLSFADFDAKPELPSAQAPRAASASVPPTSALDDDDDDDTPAPSRADRASQAAARRAPATSRREPPARTDEAALCCTKLRELGKTAPLEERASYLAAGAACDAAPSANRALKQVHSVLGGSRVGVPDECSGG